MVEVAESKAKLRKLRQQLEEKTEQLQECREELEKLSDTTVKLKAENLELCQDARAAKTYRSPSNSLDNTQRKYINTEERLSIDHCNELYIYTSGMFVYVRLPYT